MNIIGSILLAALATYAGFGIGSHVAREKHAQNWDAAGPAHQRFSVEFKDEDHVKVTSGYNGLTLTYAVRPWGNARSPYERTVAYVPMGGRGAQLVGPPPWEDDGVSRRFVTGFVSLALSPARPDR